MNYFERARDAVRHLHILTPEITNEVLSAIAQALVGSSPDILAANALDCARMDPADPKYDRLLLTETRIAGIAADMANVASLPSPLGHSLEEKTLNNGLHITRISVPLGVVGMIYEARPNVTADAFSLCFKTGNVALLKGGSDADDSNRAIVRVIHGVLERFGIHPDVVQLLPPERASTTALLQAVGWVDVVIPRGSNQLIQYVRENARVPVIETGAGVVHTFVDASADLAKAAAVIHNAKTRRVSVCNALDCLLVHSALLGALPQLVGAMAGAAAHGEAGAGGAAHGVELRADPRALEALNGRYPATLLKPATETDFGTEFLAMTLAIKTVDSFEEALEYIRKHSSGHSEAILTEDTAHADRFVHAVDAAAVYVNTSTAFTDGAQFGLGAEIGISTQKLHARGPMGLEALTSYKWIVRGDGQVRPG
ncbi:glutamate-5-semialdehyde dehydrogenase [Dinghuibacter silviterrae]|uniref:Gamma-glutamyl phosphate reductase n=1 Tax=Dinghuibacter silviterrae TaxID=1539049 RepID=A0A4R8DI64_9BACT|nr:glutamate-5-semialdehyde dehydrogenase [Dinghuibacter silviterrae]TDW97247.1 glutamate-5-semialdehyde dehydrogenase [Dinghuibacter silviterrae]